MSADMMTYCVEPQRSPTFQISYIRSEADGVLECLKTWIDVHAEEHKARQDREGRRGRGMDRRCCPQEHS